MPSLRCGSAVTGAALLDGTAGPFSLAPAAGARSSRRYLPETLILETTFTTDTGSVVLTDGLLFGRGERGHDIGLTSTHGLLEHSAQDP